jgi:2-polyprenyl-3-methyl-5-hydroxy-6-metoxy-1,4-benzoquinol methylase
MKLVSLSKLIHEERCDPLELKTPARKGIYEIRAEVFLPFAKGKNILELGCGCGYNSYLFSQTANMVVGIDKDRDSIRKASEHFKNIPNLHFVWLNALEFADTSEFDAIILFEFIEHLEFSEQKLLFNKILKVLKPNGFLFLSTPNGRFVPIYRKNPYHKKELSMDELEGLLSSHFAFQNTVGQISLVWFFLPLPWSLIEKIWLRLNIYEKMCRLTENIGTSRTIIIRAQRK